MKYMIKMAQNGTDVSRTIVCDEKKDAIKNVKKLIKNDGNYLNYEVYVSGDNGLYLNPDGGQSAIGKDWNR